MYIQKNIKPKFYPFVVTHCGFFWFNYTGNCVQWSATAFLKSGRKSESDLFYSKGCRPLTRIGIGCLKSANRFLKSDSRVRKHDSFSKLFSENTKEFSKPFDAFFNFLGFSKIFEEIFSIFNCFYYNALEYPRNFKNLPNALENFLNFWENNFEKLYFCSNSVG